MRLPACVQGVGGQGCQGTCLSNNRDSLNSCVSYGLNHKHLLSHRVSEVKNLRAAWLGGSGPGSQDGPEEAHPAPQPLGAQLASVGPLPGCSPTQLVADTRVPCWLLAEGCGSSPAPGCPHNVRDPRAGEQAGSYNASMTPALKAHPDTPALCIR